jgi:adenine-specific DNA-methyltransferase
VTDANDPIPQITRDDEAAGSGDLVAGNIARLKALFPEIVTDGKVDFDVLRDLLGDAVEEGEERYGLNWKGKRKARAFALTQSLGTLLPAPEDSVDWEATRNLMIEGDNLEVLKLLRRSYAGKVKLIYIDPPYNTGNDFVYPDNYANSISNYMEVTGQRDAERVARTSYKETSGRFHTDWLNMMYPRLMLAKELLRDDGVIFVTIDGTEVDRLGIMLDEIFGEENDQGHAVWQKKYAVSSDAKRIPPLHDHVLIYSRGASFAPGLLPRSAKQDDVYGNPDNDPRGRWRSDNLLRSEYRPRDRYEIISPLTGQRHLPPPGQSWRHPEAQMLEMIADNRVWFGLDGRNKPAAKRFLSEVRQGVVASGWWSHEVAGHNDQSKKEMQRLFDGESPFDTPKPVRLIEHVLTVGASKDDLIVDFFAGSGTTGHAVMARNATDGNNRRYILVQLPEPLDPANANQKSAAELCDKLGVPRTIAELTKERLRRAGQKVRGEHPDAKVDTGFRVYKLATSNLKPWQPDREDLEANILDAVDNILPGRTEEDLLVELLLKTGIDLTLPEEKRTIAGQTVHALGGGTLMVCLGNIGADDAEALGQGMADWVHALDPVQTTVYFKDTGLGADGNRAATKANLAAILRQRLGDRIAKIASI